MGGSNTGVVVRASHLAPLAALGCAVTLLQAEDSSPALTSDTGAAVHLSHHPDELELLMHRSPLSAFPNDLHTLDQSRRSAKASTSRLPLSPSPPARAPMGKAKGKSAPYDAIGTRGELHKCSQCRLDLPASRFPLRITTLSPYSVCSSQDRKSVV